MRCPTCNAANDEGAAVCTACGEPLTAYAATIAAEANPELTAARLAALERRPVIVMVVAIADLAAAAVAVLVALRAVAATPALTPDATNYMGRAFGGLRAVLTAAVMLPLAGGLAALAWGAMTQRGWAWSAHLAAMGLIVLVSVVTLRTSPATSVAEIFVVGLAAWHWLRPATRRWFALE